MIVLKDNLRTLRRQYSKRQVSERLDIPEKRYSAYEEGRNEPNIATLKLIADYYNMTINELCFVSISQSQSQSQYINHLKTII